MSGFLLSPPLISPLGAALASMTQIRFSSLPNLRTSLLSALLSVLLSAVAVLAVHTVLHLRARPPNNERENTIRASNLGDRRYI